MATHAYIRPGGVWNAGVMVTHAEFAAFDAAQVDSISASGGTYSPVASIIISGAGMQVLLAGTSTLPNGTTLAAAVGSAITMAGTFTTAVGSVSTFNGSANFSGSASFNGITSFTSNANFVGPWGGNGALLVSGTASFTANPSFSGNPTFSGAPSISSGGQLDVASGALLRVLSGGQLDLASGSIASVETTVTCSGAGRMVRAPVIGAASGGGTFSPLTASTYFFQAGMATQTYALSTSGVVDGDTIDISLETGVTNPLTVTGLLGGSLSMQHSTTGDIFAARVVYFAALTSWVPILVCRF